MRRATQARIEIEALGTAYLELAERRMEGIYQDVARLWEHYTGDDQSEGAAGSNPSVADAPELGARAFASPVSRQALRKSLCELLRAGDRNQHVGLAQLLHVLDVHELLERRKCGVLAAVDHADPRRIPAAAIIAGTLPRERFTDETAIEGRARGRAHGNADALHRSKREERSE